MRPRNVNVLVTSPQVVRPVLDEEPRWLDGFVRWWAEAVAELGPGRAVDPGRETGARPCAADPLTR